MQTVHALAPALMGYGARIRSANRNSRALCPGVGLEPTKPVTRRLRPVRFRRVSCRLREYEPATCAVGSLQWITRRLRPDHCDKPLWLMASVVGPIINCCGLPYIHDSRRIPAPQVAAPVTPSSAQTCRRLGTLRVGSETSVSPSGLASCRSNAVKASTSSGASKARLRRPTLT